MQKKYIVMIMILAAVLVTGCQATPEKEVVVQKDMEQMIEKAQATVSPEIEKQSLVTRYAIKEHIDNQMSEAEGKLKISIDADVFVPDTDIIPMVSVQPGRFSQETVSALFSALCGDTPMYETRNEHTKAEIDEAIIKLKELKSKAEGTGRDFDSEIEQLTEQYDSAPEEIEDVLSDGLLIEKEIYADVDSKEGYLGTNTIFTARSVPSDIMFSQGKFFFVYNNSDQTEPVEVTFVDPHEGQEWTDTIPVIYNSSMTYIEYERQLEWSWDSMKYLEDEDPIPEEAKGVLNLTPDRAKEIAESFFTEVQIPFGVQDILMISDDMSETMGLTESSGENTKKKYAYRLTCVRQAGGVNVATIDADDGKEEAYAPYWPIESITIYIDNEGIYELDWGGLYKMGETVVENANLLPFSDIEDTFFNMMVVMYEPEARNELTNEVSINVKRVELQLCRIAQQDEFESGLLVPVWCFYGNKTVDEQVVNEGMMYDWESGAPMCFIVINAVDGSVIEIDNGV